MAIDWKKFESSYIKFVEATPKHLIITKWEQVDSSFKDEKTGLVKPALDLEVIQEDGVVCSPVKSWELSNVKAIKAIRPLIEKAEREGKNVLSVTVTRMGTGAATVYGIVETSPIV